MGNLLKKGSDNLLNGTILGAILGLAIVYGDKILAEVTKIIPSSWYLFESTTLSLALILGGAGALIGYILDRI